MDIEVGGRKVEVEIWATGLSPNLVHAPRIHGVGANECPADRHDRGRARLRPIMVSLTTKGHTSPACGLAVDRFPVANKRGKLRTSAPSSWGRTSRAPWLVLSMASTS